MMGVSDSTLKHQTKLQYELFAFVDEILVHIFEMMQEVQERTLTFASIPQVCKRFYRLTMLNDAFINYSLDTERSAIKAAGNTPSPCGMLATLTLHLRRDAYHHDGYRIVSDEKSYNTKTARAENLIRLTLGYERRHRVGVPLAVFLLGEKLQTLGLHNNSIAYLPDAVGNLTNLTAINVQENKLTALPQSFTNLQKLQSLSIQENRIASLPETISRLSNLTTIYMYKNELAVIPDSIATLTKLETLSMHSNPKLKSLPLMLYDSLVNIKDAYLGECDMEEFPKALFSVNPALEHQSHFTRLKTMSFTYAKFEKETVPIRIPDSVGLFVNLTSIMIRYTNLQVIPDSIGDCSSLETLDLWHNKIEAITNTVTKLSKLKLVYMSANDVKSLPLGISALTSLTDLYINNNPNLTEIRPAELEQLKSLKCIEVNHTKVDVETIFKEYPRLEKEKIVTSLARW